MPTVAAERLFIQAQSLNLCPHRPVEDQDAFLGSSGQGLKGFGLG
ncbi:hypothetical protein EPIB2_913 [Tritonibacter mobilis]|nr:hypothetical protein EPIB2_913 [Tritonibacter mobilis]